MTEDWRVTAFQVRRCDSSKSTIMTPRLPRGRVGERVAQWDTRRELFPFLLHLSEFYSNSQQMELDRLFYN